MRLTLGLALMFWGISSLAEQASEAVVSTEGGFVDISLRVLKHEEKADGTLHIQVRSSLGGETVGFAIDFLPQWKKSPIENTGRHFYWGNGAFVRTGEETDRFLSEIARLYRVTKVP